MKTRLLPSLAMACLLAPVVAQVPNGGFENWGTPTGASYLEPDGWLTLNSLATYGGGAPTTEQGSPGAVGSHYATLTTRQTTVLGLISGYLMSGDTATGIGGFPYTGRPTALTGQWQYGIQPQDTGLVFVYFSKWNPVTQESDSVGAAAVFVQGTLSGWNAMNIPITYFNSNIPDTAVVFLSSSFQAPVAGSFIKVDALGFDGPSGITEVASTANVSVYPSPATNVLNVASDQQVAEVDVLDMTGRTLLKNGAFVANTTLDVAALNSGRYLIQLRMVDGTRSVKSFVKQ